MALERYFFWIFWKPFWNLKSCKSERYGETDQLPQWTGNSSRNRKKVEGILFVFPEKTWFLFLKKSKNIQKIPFQGHHSKFEFLECCLKNGDDPQGGRGLRPPPWGILAFSRNREIKISSDGLGKCFLLIFIWFSRFLIKTEKRFLSTTGLGTNRHLLTDT